MKKTYVGLFCSTSLSLLIQKGVLILLPLLSNNFSFPFLISIYYKSQQLMICQDQNLLRGIYTTFSTKKMLQFFVHLIDD